jgi:hypothetical protein
VMGEIWEVDSDAAGRLTRLFYGSFVRLRRERDGSHGQCLYTHVLLMLSVSFVLVVR